ncbi:hypothetical protein DID80_00075 [Candidatus Marinamargulisbacteria bacterium SCGC AAA071-K20]|nr:hypothetical protein DID80_00075 [Candidatus Marinamargulisbacteria bacterium SCGC AAA071-K20]
MIKKIIAATGGKVINSFSRTIQREETTLELLKRHPDHTIIGGGLLFTGAMLLIPGIRDVTLARMAISTGLGWVTGAYLNETEKLESFKPKIIKAYPFIDRLLAPVVCAAIGFGIGEYLASLISDGASSSGNLGSDSSSTGGADTSGATVNTEAGIDGDSLSGSAGDLSTDASTTTGLGGSILDTIGAAAAAGTAAGATASPNLPMFNGSNDLIPFRPGASSGTGEGTRAGDSSTFAAEANIIVDNRSLASTQIVGLGALATKDDITPLAKVTDPGTLAGLNVVDAGSVTGLGELATKDVVDVGSVTGLGELATKDVVDAGSVTGLGPLAGKDKVDVTTDVKSEQHVTFVNVHDSSASAATSLAQINSCYAAHTVGTPQAETCILDATTKDVVDARNVTGLGTLARRNVVAAGSVTGKDYIDSECLGKMAWFKFHCFGKDLSMKQVLDATSEAFLNVVDFNRH